MTNDESEIRRLAHKVLYTPCPSFFENDFVHRHECDRIADAIRTALAAEREQHARDVAEARAETWKQVITCARIRASRGETALQLLEALYRKSSAQALNDSRKGEPAAEGRPTPERAPAVPAPSPVPPSGINQGSGAGEAYYLIERNDRGRPEWMAWRGRDEMTWTTDVHQADRYDWPFAAQGDARALVARGLPVNVTEHLDIPTPSPASPTGETRDDGKADCNCGSATWEHRFGDPGCEYENHHCDRCHERKLCTAHPWPESEPASATGGAPSVERMRALFNAARKPRTTVAKFATELKARIAKVEAAFMRPGQEAFVAGAGYIKGVVDGLLSDYDVRDPEDFARMAAGRRPSAPGGAPGVDTCKPWCGGSGRELLPYDPDDVGPGPAFHVITVQGERGIWKRLCPEGRMFCSSACVARHAATCAGTTPTPSTETPPTNGGRNDEG